MCHLPDTMYRVCTGVKVSLNGARLPVKDFKGYVEKVLENREGDFPVIHEVVNDRWEVCMTVSNSGFQQVSFVNSIATTKGGTHVNYITDQIVKELTPIVTKKNKAAPVKAHQIKAHLWVFVNALIENPTFDSQTKENHTLAASKFGSKAQLSPKFMKSVAKSGIVDNILVWAKVKVRLLTNIRLMCYYCSSSSIIAMMHHHYSSSSSSIAMMCHHCSSSGSIAKEALALCLLPTLVCSQCHPTTTTSQ